MILIDPSDVAVITFNWTDAIPATSPLTTLSSVTHTAPSPLVKEGESTNTSAKTSACKVSGGVHGKTYMLQASATLSNGETINRAATLRCIDA